MSRRSRASRAIATGVSVSATLAGVGLIAHADDTPGTDDPSASGPIAVPAALITGLTGATVRGAAGSATSTVVTATTVLEQPGRAQLPTKSTEPALSLPVSSFDTATTIVADTAPAPVDIPAPGAPRTGSGNTNSGNTSTASTASTASTGTTVASPVATAVPTATPTETTAAPAPPPDTTAPPPPPPPPTLPPLTAPPDDTSRGTT